MLVDPTRTDRISNREHRQRKAPHTYLPTLQIHHICGISFVPWSNQDREGGKHGTAVSQHDAAPSLVSRVSSAPAVRPSGVTGHVKHVSLRRRRRGDCNFADRAPASRTKAAGGGWTHGKAQAADREGGKRSDWSRTWTMFVARCVRCAACHVDTSMCICRAIGSSHRCLICPPFLPLPRTHALCGTETLEVEAAPCSWLVGSCPQPAGARCGIRQPR